MTKTVVGTLQKWPAKAGGHSPKGPAVAGTTTVVPALGDPCRERPPALYDHVINAPTDTFQRENYI